MNKRCATSPKLVRGKLSLGLSCLTLVLGLAACTPAPVPVTLHLLTRWTEVEPIYRVWKQAQRDFMVEHPNVTIVDDSINDGVQFENRLGLLLASGKTPAIFSVDGVLRMAAYARQGVILDLSAAYQSDVAWTQSLLPTGIEAVRTDTFDAPGVYGVPLASAIEVFYYNKTLFSRAGLSQPPATYEELVQDVRMLAAAGVTPIGLGGQAPWRAGHLHNAVLCKSLGNLAAYDLGWSRQLSWDSADVIETLQRLVELKDAGAFSPSFASITYEQEKADFLAGRSAMVFNGTWFLGEVAASPLADQVGVFLFPPRADRPQFAGHNIVYPQNLSISAKLTSAEQEAALGFLKFFTSAAVQEALVYETKNLSARSNLKIDSRRAGGLFYEVTSLAAGITAGAGDSFAYDPVAGMDEITRSALMSVLLGETAESAAKSIQSHVSRPTSARSP